MSNSNFTKFDPSDLLRTLEDIARAGAGLLEPRKPPRHAPQARFDYWEQRLAKAYAGRAYSHSPLLRGYPTKP